MALLSDKITSKLILGLNYKLNCLGKHTIIHLRWIKAHVGHLGNEMADSMAKRGAENVDNLPITNIPASYAYVKRTVNNKLEELWSEEWSSTQDMKQSKYWFPKPTMQKCSHMKDLNRNKFSILVRWLTGHAFLNRQNHLVLSLIHI